MPLDDPTTAPAGDEGAIDAGPEAAAMAYASTWLVDEDLQSLNRRIHDGVADDALMDRARAYREWLFSTYPEAQPGPGTRVMELGSGVGWIMEAVLERFPLEEIIGLDISANLIKRAQERFSSPKARFVLYDGFHMPFEDGDIDVIYSVASMQHIEKHVAFLLFEELFRILAPGGHAVIHLLAVDHIPGSAPDYHDECWNHVRNVPTHWHHYYSFDELFVLFSEVIEVDDLDVVYEEASRSFLVHFGKQTGKRYRRPELPTLRHSARLAAPAAAAPPPPPSPRELGVAFAHRLYRRGRAQAARWRRRN